MKKIFTLLFALFTICMAKAETATFNFKSVDQWTAWGIEMPSGSSARLTDGCQLTVGDVTLTIKRGSEKTSLFKANPDIRFYNGEELTITTTSGVLKKVEFTCLSEAGSVGANFNCGSSSKEELVITWTGDDQTLVMPITANLFLTSMTVYTGEACAVKYPTFTPGSVSFIDGFETPAKVTIATATEGASIMYKVGDGEYAAYPAEGISITESCVVTAKAVVGDKESVEAFATYTIIPTTKVAEVAALDELKEGDYVVIDAPLTVVTYDSYDGSVFVTDGKSGMAIKTDGDFKAGDVIAAGWVGYIKSTWSYDRAVTPAVELSVSEGTAVKPAWSTIEAMAAKEVTYQYVTIKGAQLKVEEGWWSNNYYFLDNDGNKVQLSSEFITLPTDETKVYDATGIVAIYYGDLYFYPIVVAEHLTTFEFNCVDQWTAWGIKMPSGASTRLTDGLQLTVDDVTLTIKKGSEKTSLFKANPDIRFYNKEELTITTTSGVLKKIEFTCLSEAGSKGANFSCGSSSKEELVITWTGDDQTLVMPITGNLYLTSMTVYTGEACAVKYPTFTPGSVSFIDGFETPAKVTIATATEGASIMYKVGDGEYAAYPAEGISITESCVVTAKAVVGDKESVEAFATYTVIPTTTVTEVAKLDELEEGTYVVIDAPLTVVTYDSWDGAVFVTDGKSGMSIKVASADYKAGDVIAAGWVGYIKSTSAYDRAMVPAVELSVSEGAAAEPVATTIAAIAADEVTYQYVTVSGAKLKVEEGFWSNNYYFYDNDGNTVELSNEFIDLPTDDSKLYCATGIVVKCWNTITFYPTEVSEDTLTGINAVESAAKSEIYTISGVRLNKAQRGVNIVNGKKVVIK